MKTKTTAQKRRQEQDTMARMIALYCQGQRHTPDGTLCPACHQLQDYAAQRIARCPHMAHKSFCSRCPTPCYQPDMRQRVRQVMRYAGPRMLLHSPLLVLRHALAGRGPRPAKPNT